jgi:hypothetical protein
MKSLVPPLALLMLSLIVASCATPEPNPMPPPGTRSSYGPGPYNTRPTPRDWVPAGGTAAYGR